MNNFILKIINWIRKDGFLHIILTTAIFDITAILGQAWWIGLIFAILCDIMREVGGIIASVQNKKKIDWKDIGHDLICDLIGITIGFAIYFIYINIVFNSK